MEGFARPQRDRAIGTTSRKLAALPARTPHHAGSAASYLASRAARQLALEVCITFNADQSLVAQRQRA